jgi:hypothetical protein
VPNISNRIGSHKGFRLNGPKIGPEWDKLAVEFMLPLLQVMAEQTGWQGFSLFSGQKRGKCTFAHLGFSGWIIIPPSLRLLQPMQCPSLHLLWACFVVMSAIVSSNFGLGTEDKAEFGTNDFNLALNESNNSTMAR